VSSTGLIPDTADPVSGPFWAGARRGALCVQRCLSCEALRFPPLVGCPECLSRDTEWIDVPAVGSIWSYVVYHRAFQAALKDDVPYTVVVVELDAGPFITGRLAAEHDVTIGARVSAEFVPVTADYTQIRWRLSGGKSGG
jgi:uncharacterized protein